MNCNQEAGDIQFNPISKLQMLPYQEHNYLVVVNRRLLVVVFIPEHVVLVDKCKHCIDEVVLTQNFWNAKVP